jgi:hypothetical protein
MNNGRIRQWRAISLSVPEPMLDAIDLLRHDVSRSKYVARVLEEHLKLMESSG